MIALSYISVQAITLRMGHMQVFIQALSLMSVFWKKTEFYKGKVGDCNRKCGLGHSPGEVSGDKAPIFFSFFFFFFFFLTF